MTENIDYSGNPKDYKPPIGDNLSSGTPTRSGRNLLKMRDDLIDNLKTLKEMSKMIMKETESKLDSVGVVVPPISDVSVAKSQEWPTGEIDEPDVIGFSFYKAMDKKGSSGSQLVRSYYKDNISISKHSSALDVHEFCEVMIGEANRIEDLLTNTLGDSIGSEAQATYRLLYEWTQDAITVTGNIGLVEEQVKEQQRASSFESEMGKVSGADAKRLQALYQGKVNALNTAIATDIEYLKKSHGYLADKYYNQYLGPALNLHQNAVSDIRSFNLPEANGLAEDVSYTTQIYNSQLKVALADQVLRNKLFKEKSSLIMANLVQRQQFVNMIDILSESGSSTTPRVIEREVPKAEKEYFNNYTGTGESVFKASHAFLQDSDDDAAHPQYLLKAGDTITGDISVDDGITIDGVDISEHKHTGADGSQQIEFSDIDLGDSLEINIPTTFVDTVTFEDDITFQNEITFEDTVVFEDDVTVLGTLYASSIDVTPQAATPGDESTPTADYDIVIAGYNLTKPPVSIFVKTSNVSVAHDTFQAIGMSTGSLQNSIIQAVGDDPEVPGYSTVRVVSYSNPTFTINATGWYKLTVNHRWQVDGTGTREMYLEINGSRRAWGGHPAGGTLLTENHQFSDSRAWWFEAGDTFFPRVRQDSGAPIDLDYMQIIVEWLSF